MTSSYIDKKINDSDIHISYIIFKKKCHIDFTKRKIKIIDVLCRKDVRGIRLQENPHSAVDGGVQSAPHSADQTHTHRSKMSAPAQFPQSSFKPYFPTFGAK